MINNKTATDHNVYCDCQGFKAARSEGVVRAIFGLETIIL